MYYDIIMPYPQKDAFSDFPLAQWGPTILLYPEFKSKVVPYLNYTNEQVKYWCDGLGKRILEANGFNYGEVRIVLGDWGLEHIAVPGNACGLDIWDDMCAPDGGMSLLPHNVDSRMQCMALITVFTWFMHTASLNSRNA